MGVSVVVYLNEQSRIAKGILGSEIQIPKSKRRPGCRAENNLLTYTARMITVGRRWASTAPMRFAKSPASQTRTNATESPSPDFN